MKYLEFLIILVSILPEASLAFNKKSHIITLPEKQNTNILAEQRESINFLSAKKLQEIAASITVKIISDRNNSFVSGTIIGKSEQTYLIAAEASTIAKHGNLRLQTNDGQIHRAELVKDVVTENSNLALLKFNSQNNYQVANLDTKTFLRKGYEVFAAGFSEETSLVFSRGKISKILDQALQQEYQIAYSSDREEETRGGPILNVANGKLIGINGKKTDSIGINSYYYEDNSPVPQEIIKNIEGSNWGITIENILAKSSPEIIAKFQLPEPKTTAPKLAGKAAEIDKIARKITVRIERANGQNGTGVIVDRQNDTYYVLTAFHVVKDKNIKYEIIAPDGQRYGVDYSKVKSEPKIDLAVVQFTSKNNYRVGVLADYKLGVDQKRWVFVAGWPQPENVQLRNWKFSSGMLLSKELGLTVAKNYVSFSNGYDLVYSDITVKGMSGGPVLDSLGRVIGIHGRAEGEVIIDQAATERFELQLGFSLGIPVRRFLSFASQFQLNRDWLNVEQSLPPKLDAGQMESLRKSAREKLEAPQENASATQWLRWGNQLWRLDRAREAVEAYNRALALNPPFAAQVYYAKGLALIQAEKYRDAISVLDKALSLKPDFYEARRWQARMLMQLQQYPEALASVEKAIALNKRDFLSYYLQGELLAVLKRYSEAVEAYTEAIKYKPDYGIAYNSRGLARSQLGDVTNAIADYTRAIAIRADDVDAYSNRAIARNQLKDFQGAIADLSQAIKYKPDMIVAYYLRGTARARLEDFRGAISDYNSALKYDRQYAPAYFNRGNVYYKLGDFRRAIEDYSSAIAYRPHLAIAYYNRGNARYRRGNLQGAINDYNSTIKIKPDYVKAYNNIGLVQYEKGSVDEAIAQWQQTTKITSDFAEAQLALAVALYSKGETEKAFEIGQIALASDKRLTNLNYLKEQYLWGDRLRKDAQKLFSNPRIQAFLSNNFP